MLKAKCGPTWEHRTLEKAPDTTGSSAQTSLGAHQQDQGGSRHEEAALLVQPGGGEQLPVPEGVMPPTLHFQTFSLDSIMKLNRLKLEKEEQIKPKAKRGRKKS